MYNELINTLPLRILHGFFIVVIYYIIFLDGGVTSLPNDLFNVGEIEFYFVGTYYLADRFINN